MEANGVGVLGPTLSKEEFDVICRCCLSPSPLSSIFELTYEETPFMKIFCSLFGAELDPEDDLPKKICETCIGEVIHCYNFKKSYEASEAALLSIIAIKTEEVDADIKSEPLKDNFEEHALMTQQPTVDDESDKGTDIEENEQNVDVKTQTQSDTLTCSCEITFASKLELQYHQLHHHPPRHHPCEICGKLFPKSRLWQHTKTHQAVKPFGCDYCETRFVSSANLRRHMSIHTGEKPYVCDVCGKAFAQLKSLQVHSVIHTGEKPYLCALCGKSFRYETSHKIHMRTHNKKSPTTAKKNICGECGRVYYSESAYKFHLYKHGLGEGQVAEGVQHQCEVCKKFYSSRRSLIHHMRIHKEKKFLCNECGKRFCSNYALASHLLSHKGEKSLSCVFCDKKFAHQRALQQHRSVHAEEKPYACTLCSKKFKQSTHLKRHLVLHTGDRPYVCRFCDKSYLHKGSLKTHIQIVHTGEKQQKHQQI